MPERVPVCERLCLAEPDCDATVVVIAADTPRRGQTTVMCDLVQLEGPTRPRKKLQRQQSLMATASQNAQAALYATQSQAAMYAGYSYDPTSAYAAGFMAGAGANGLTRSATLGSNPAAMYAYAGAAAFQPSQTNSSAKQFRSQNSRDHASPELDS